MLPLQVNIVVMFATSSIQNEIVSWNICIYVNNLLPYWSS